MKHIVKRVSTLQVQGKSEWLDTMDPREVIGLLYRFETARGGKGVHEVAAV